MGMRRDFPLSDNGDDAPRLVVFKVINLQPSERGGPMKKAIREGVVRVEVDLVKRVIQVHSVDAARRVLSNEPLAASCSLNGASDSDLPTGERAW